MEQEYQAPQLWSQLEMARNLMSPYQLRWDRCENYINNNQLFGYSSSGKDDATPIDMRRRKGKLQINQLVNLYRQVTAQLITEYPSMAALPASDEDDDIEKSLAAETTLRYYWQAAKMRKVLRKAINWLVSAGTVGLRTRYNTQKKMVETEAIRPYDLRFEPYVNDPNDSAWIGVCSYVRLADLKAQYPEHAESLEQHASPAVRYYTYGPRSLPEDRYELYDVYHKEGRHEVWAGGTCCYSEETPGRRMPIQIIRYTEIEGFCWGMGLIEPLLESQDLYNDMRTQIRQNAKLMGNPKVLIPSEGKVSNKAFTDQPGEKILYSGGTPPTSYQVPPLPQYIVEEPARIQSEMFDISGISGTVLGKRTIGVTSGVAIEQTAKNSVQQLQLTQDAIEDSVREVAADVLAYIKAYYNESKMVRMLDRAGKLIWSELSATRLEDDPEIFLEAGSLFRSEAQDRESKAMQYAKLGIITPEEAKKSLTFRTEPLKIIEQLEGLHHAREVLEAVVVLGPRMGPQIDPMTGQPLLNSVGKPILQQLPRAKIFPTDDLDALENVFGKYMRSEDFYKLDPPAQDAVENTYQQILDLMAPPQAMPGAPAVTGNGGGDKPQSSPNTMPGAGTPPLPASVASVQKQADNAQTASDRVGQVKASGGY